MSDQDLSQFSMHDLFRLEVEGQREVLTSGLLALERQPDAAGELEACMRSAHSLKGAARIVGLSAAVAVAHAMEDCFVAAQHRRVLLDKSRIDLLLRGLDLLVTIANTDEAQSAQWMEGTPAVITAFQTDLAAALSAQAPAKAARPKAARTGKVRTLAPMPDSAAAAAASGELEAIIATPNAGGGEGKDRTLRVAAQNLNRLLGLSGESLVESRWLTPFAESLLRLKRMQADATRRLGLVQE